MTLPPLVERKHGEGALGKLTSDISEIMAYGEGIRESLPKSLVSSGSSKAENAQTSTSQVIVNSQVPSVLNFNLSAMQATIQKDVDVAITELKATTFEELLRCRNEIADLRKEFKKVRQTEQTLTDVHPIATSFNEVEDEVCGSKEGNIPDSRSSPQSEDKNAEQADESTSIKEKPGISKTTSNDKVVLLVSDSLLHKLDPRKFYIKGTTVRLAKSGDKAVNVGKRAVDYVKQNSKCTFEAVVLLGGTNDLTHKSS